MFELYYINFLFEHDKISCCKYLLELIQPILFKKKITKKDYELIFYVLNFCNLVNRNRNDEISKNIMNRTILYYSILFNKTLDK